MAALKRMFRIQYVSDLHIERYEKATFPLLVKPAARYLALAGDIGKPGHFLFENFLQYVSHNWEKVFYVAGTTELSSSTSLYQSHRNLMTSTSRYPNIHYLHHSWSSAVTKEDVAIVGATLWPCKEKYPRIRMDGATEAEVLGPPFTHRVQAHTKRMLEDQIQYRTARKQSICMITHHMPSPQLISPRFRHISNNRYIANCEELMGPPIKAWIYGKTHNVATGMVNGTFTAVNARGYPTEVVPGFSPSAFLEFAVEEQDSEMDAELAKSAYQNLIT